MFGGSKSVSFARAVTIICIEDIIHKLSYSLQRCLVADDREWIFAGSIGIIWWMG